MLLAAVLAGVWLVGGLFAGPQHLGRLVAAGSIASCRSCSAWSPSRSSRSARRIVSWIGPLHHAVIDVVSRADTGSRALVVAITVVNGIAEEVFFRGAVYRLSVHAGRLLDHRLLRRRHGCRRQRDAGAGRGTDGRRLVALERRATGGILASALTHITWSVLVIFLLPR